MKRSAVPILLVALTLFSACARGPGSDDGEAVGTIRGAVLLVEDIVDSGLTLNYLLKNLRGRRPASLEVCALLKKTGIQRVHLDLRYVGFEIPPDFVVGYGLDFAERFRNLPYVGLLKPDAYSDT